MAFPLDTLLDLFRSVHSDGGDDEFLRVDASGVPITGTMDQGDPNTVANAWPVKITDGTDTANVTVAGALQTDGSAVTQPVSAASLPLPTGASTLAEQQTQSTSLASIDSKLTSPVTVTGPLTDAQLRATPVPVSATDLDIRNLTFAADKVDASGSTLGANSGVDIGDVTINNAAGASAVNIQDGGNSITVDGPLTDAELRATAVPVSGPLTDTQLRATPVPVSATNLDIRDLTFAADKVDASGSAVTVTGTSTITGTVSTKTDLTPSSPTAATVGVASAQAVAANATRKGLVLINTSVNTISLGLGAAAAVLNSGITLYPGGSWVMDEYTFDISAVNAIASAASSNLSIQEFTT